jgi:predicted GNAT family N-acyltransferase
MGARRLVLHAQTYVRSLYEQAGYRPRGGVFREAGIEHVAMERELG